MELKHQTLSPTHITLCCLSAECSPDDVSLNVHTPPAGGARRRRRRKEETEEEGTEEETEEHFLCSCSFNQLTSQLPVILLHHKQIIFHYETKVDYNN